MTLPDLLQAAALIIVCFAVVGMVTGHTDAVWLIMVALALITVAIIVKTDHK